MSAEELLRSTEKSALTNTQHISSVSGKGAKIKSRKKLASWGATGLIVAMVAVAAIIFSSGNLIPAKIQERLIEETDVQYADMVASKMLAFQQALYQGDIPDDTAENLKVDGISVGYMDDGEFIEDNKSGVSSVLNTGNEIITADDFITKVYEDINIYNAINDATYGRAAGYYDEEAYKIIEEIGTSRNNYSRDTSIAEVMDKRMGEGSDVRVNSVSLVEETEEDPDTGETITTYQYEENGPAARSGNEAEEFVESVRTKITAADITESTLESADSLKVADTISKEQRSSLFYLLFMENVSKMKAGDGNESQINEAMNYLYKTSETEVVDVRTGEVIKMSGTALDSPSLYAVLAGSDNLNMEMVGNYSSDRILKTTENQIGINNGSADIIIDTVTSTDDKTKGSVGRFIYDDTATGSAEILNKVTPTVNASLVENSYSTLEGINAGEFLVEGAVNVGKRLAKASGATAGSEAAAAAYGRLNAKILALEAKSDRMKRSPFDITSRNTFLGSIVYNFAVAGSRFSGMFSKINTFSAAVGQATISLISSTYADGDVNYLDKIGDCETYATIGAVGSAQCSEIAVFDTSTLNNPFGNPDFINFIEENTTLDDNGVRTINDGSDLARFIIYNDERKTPLGVTDGGILDSLSNESGSVPFISSILSLIEIFFGADEEDMRIATGEAFVNSEDNADWETYKYAQRYISLARATAILKQYSSDSTAYNSMKYFEGSENPVVAYKNHYYNDIAVNK
ncbi:hypothetical protein IIY66_01175 [Candidatus Saccharibacteria bacterium]|nr:hypothetical protein [Candidatus Saccharibacteria bacterium]